MHILIVDDDPQTLDSLTEQLEKLGHITTKAIHGRQALSAFRQGVDVMLCDIIMPEMDGLELIQAVRKQHPGVRIVAYTGGSSLLTSMDTLDVAKSLGACMVLHKNELFDRLQHIVSSFAE